MVKYLNKKKTTRNQEYPDSWRKMVNAISNMMQRKKPKGFYKISLQLLLIWNGITGIMWKMYTDMMGQKWTVLGQSGRSMGVKLDGPKTESWRSYVKVDGPRKKLHDLKGWKWTVKKTVSGRSRNKKIYDHKGWKSTIVPDRPPWCKRPFILDGPSTFARSLPLRTLRKVCQQKRFFMLKKYGDSNQYIGRALDNFQSFILDRKISSYSKLSFNSCAVYFFYLSDKLISELKPKVKGRPDPSHFIFEINIVKSRIWHRETLKLNFESIEWLGSELSLNFKA